VSRVARHTLTLVTAPTTEPVTEDEAKTWAKIDTTADDAIVGQLITAARMGAEEFMRRALITQSWKLTLDLAGNSLNDSLPEGTYDLPISVLYGSLGRSVELPKGVIQSITSATTYALDNSSSVYDPSNYFLDTAGGRLVLNIGSIWPANMRQRAACEIVYVAGYGSKASDVPQPIKTGLLIHVASMYEQRGQSADAMALPPGSRQLYNQYRIVADRL
jgi:hypothetical protein